MLQGMFGKRLAEHFSLLESSSLVLGPKGNSQVALTRMRMPNGFPGPTPHIPPEKAFSISVHLRRPDSIKGWGTWLDGRFHRVTEWDAGGIQIFDMESEPVALRTSGFDSVHVYIPRSVINRFSDENEQKRIRNLHCTPGTKDDVILHWARMMLPFSDRPLQLPRLVIDEMIMMFCAHLSRTYQGRSQPPEVVTGGLTIWQQDRAIEVLNEHLDGDLALADLAKECGLSAGRFMRAFKRSFGVPVRRYLLYKRVEAANWQRENKEQKMTAAELMHHNFDEIFIELDPVKREAMMRNAYTEDCVWIHPGGRLVGIAAINEAASEIRKRIPEYRYKVVGDIRTMHNVGMCRWGSGLPDQPFRYTGTDVLEERDGRVAVFYTFIDSGTPPVSSTE